MSMPRWITSTLEEAHVPFLVRSHRRCYTAPGSCVGGACLGASPGEGAILAGAHEDAIEMASADWRRITQPSIGQLAASLN